MGSWSVPTSLAVRCCGGRPTASSGDLSMRTPAFESTGLSSDRMRILFALTYYRPHVSGLTIYVQRLAEALAERGHQVSVLTSQFDRTLPATELLNGVRVTRVPVALRLNKG